MGISHPAILHHFGSREALMRELLLAAAVGLLPVLIFLVSLVWLDSYKLVPLRNIVMTIGVGGLSAAAAAGINLGGGQGVIIGDPVKDKNELVLRSFGRFVESLNG